MSQKPRLEFFDYRSEIPQLDFDRYYKTIWKLIASKSFFKRFNSLASVEKRHEYEKILKGAEVELYGKD